MTDSALDPSVRPNEPDRRPGADLSASQLLNWDAFQGVPVAAAAPLMYGHATAYAKRTKGWYWHRVSRVRMYARAVVVLSLLASLIGVLCPILGPVFAEHDHLRVVTVGVAALAFTGVLQAADRVFGWSSGWIRYVQTAMALEARLHEFELAWAGVLLAGSGPLAESQKVPLFDLVSAMERDFRTTKDAETKTWASEFSNGLAELRALVKQQHEAVEATRTSANAQVKTAADAARPGRIQVTLPFEIASPRTFAVSIEGQEPVAVRGPSWVSGEVAAGLRVVRVSVPGADGAAHTCDLAVVVAPNEVAKVTVATL